MKPGRLAQLERGQRVMYEGNVWIVQRMYSPGMVDIRAYLNGKCHDVCVPVEDVRTA